MGRKSNFRVENHYFRIENPCKWAGQNPDFVFKDPTHSHDQLGSEYGPNMFEYGPNMSEYGPNMSEYDPNTSEYGEVKILIFCLRIWNTATTNLGPSMVRICQNMVRICPNMVRIYPNMSEYGPNISEYVRIWSEYVRILWKSRF